MVRAKVRRPGRMAVLGGALVRVGYGDNTCRPGGRTGAHVWVQPRPWVPCVSEPCKK